MHRRRRMTFVTLLSLLTIAASLVFQNIENQHITKQNKAVQTTTNQQLATSALETLEIKGRAPKTGYKRDLFGQGWQQSGECDTRNTILARDLQHTVIENCKVQRGTLEDPYTGKTIHFSRGANTSDDVQIDHVVALSDAWQKGAQQLDQDTRETLANDPLELLAVDGESNQQKSDSDAASWLPPNKEYRCRYVARQIAVKQKYVLWITQAEHDAMKRVLHNCPDQVLPITQP